MKSQIGIGWERVEQSILADVIGGRRISVLVVDDHDLVAESFRRILDAERDMDVVGIATSVDDAVEAARRLTPDVVLMDYVLPDGNGVEATTRILAELPDTRIVLLSGSGAERALPDALAAGCVGWVQKSAALQELAQAVRAAAD